MITKIKKRDGREVPFNIEKISNAIFKAAQAVGGQDYKTSMDLAEKVVNRIQTLDFIDLPTVEDIQDSVEKVLIEEGHAKTAKEYILYRAERNRVREMNTRLMKIFEDLTFNGESSNLAETSKSIMFKYASESSKKFYDLFVLNPEHSKADKAGEIHIDNLEFLTLTTNNCQLDLIDMFKEKFEFNHISSYFNVILTSLQLNQNDQYGHQSIPNFDYLIAVAVKNVYKHQYRKNLKEYVDLLIKDIDLEENLENMFSTLEIEYKLIPSITDKNLYIIKEKEYLKEIILDEDLVDKLQQLSLSYAYKEIDEQLYIAMKDFIFSLNLLSSNIGGSNLLTTINYGTDISSEGRLVIKNIIKASYDYVLLNKKYIYPVHIFKLKDGTNLRFNDPNYDLLKKSYKLLGASKSLNYSFMDADYNIKYYDENFNSSEVAYTADGYRIIDNVYDKDKSVVSGRGNLSSTVINLPRLALESEGNIGDFFKLLDSRVNLVITQLLERFEIQASKKVKNYPFLMGKGIWMDSQFLEDESSIRQVLKHGNLNLGFIGLRESLIILEGKDHSESLESQELGIRIIKYLRDRMDDISEQYSMNFQIMSYNDNAVSKKFLKLDYEKFGLIEGVTDQEHYSLGFNLDKDSNISLLERIKIEAPYHKLTNGGHRTKLYLDEKRAYSWQELYLILLTMMEKGIGFCNLKLI